MIYIDFSHKYAIVIPCYNEAHRINDTIAKTKKALKGIRNYIIYVIDDNSSDDIVKVVKEDNHCELIRFTEGPSRRENMARAIHRFIDADVIAFMDADLSTDLKDLNKLLTSVTDFTPIVIGNKYDDKSHIERNGFRLVVSKLMNLFTRVLFNTGLDDHFIGFKAFKSEVIKELIEESGFDNKFRSMFWDAEILIRAKWHHYNIKTIPVDWIEGKKSSLKLYKDTKIILYMFIFWVKSWISKI